jgi:hypothetical protein
MTRADLPIHVEETFAETVTRFRRTRAELVGVRERIPADQRVAGYGRDDTLVIRTFETWTHHDDIRAALGHDTVVPESTVMRAMTELAMRSLPLALSVQGLARPGRSARLVLSGPGGGEWTIPGAPGETPGTQPDVVIHASAVEWCRRFADRADPADMAIEVDGDESFARDLVAASNAFAGL